MDATRVLDPRLPNWVAVAVVGTGGGAEASLERGQTYQQTDAWLLTRAPRVLGGFLSLDILELCFDFA